MKRALLVCAVALVLVPSASAIESTIYPGVGIGKVKLGMTQAQVQRALGKWRFVNERKENHLGVGWGFGEWTVDFVAGHVVQVATTLVAQKTRTRVGPGSTWRTLVRAYPHGVCTINTGSYAITGRLSKAEYLVAHKGGTQTIYFVPQPKPTPGFAESPRTWRVSEVRVRTPWQRLDEFGPNWQSHCHPGWRTRDAPL